jgi:hypothetical protein
MRSLALLFAAVLILGCPPVEAQPRAKLEAGRVLMFIGTLAVVAGAITTTMGLGGGADQGCKLSGSGSCGSGLNPILAGGVATLSIGVAGAGVGATLYAVGRRQQEPPATPLLALRF